MGLLDFIRRAGDQAERQADLALERRDTQIDYDHQKAVNDFNEHADPEIQLEQARQRFASARNQLVGAAQQVMAHEEEIKLTLEAERADLAELNRNLNGALAIVKKARDDGDEAKAARLMPAGESIFKRVQAQTKKVAVLEDQLETAKAASLEAQNRIDDNADDFREFEERVEAAQAKIAQANLLESSTAASREMEAVVTSDFSDLAAIEGRINGRVALATAGDRIIQQSPEAAMAAMEREIAASSASSGFAAMLADDASAIKGKPATPEITSGN